MTDSIDYGQLMHHAMRGLLAELLDHVGQNGLPGEHHFFITFDTTHEEVDMAKWLFESYPEEMTIVIQHWFENLETLDDGFTITLNFGDAPEPLYIPWDAVRTFVDPSVEFGLRFEAEGAVPEESPMIEIDGTDEDAAPPKPADVVSLDSFRKD